MIGQARFHYNEGMAQEIAGSLDAQWMRVGIIVAQFNEAITSRLLSGAREAAAQHGVREDRLAIVRVPGSFELPQAAARMARDGSCDALVALGCVIRGETAHFDFVAAEAARGIAEVARSAGKAVSFGVLTTNTMEQAMARSGGAAGNRGFDAMESAIKMANLHRRLDEADGLVGTTG